MQPEIDNVTTTYDTIKKKESLWERLFGWKVSTYFKFVVCGIGLCNALGVAWCAYHRDAHGIIVVALMTLGTFWVTEANEVPYS